MDEVIKLRRALEAGLEYAIDAANDCKAKDRMFDQIMNDVRRIEAEIDRIKDQSHGPPEDDTDYCGIVVIDDE